MEATEFWNVNPRNLYLVSFSFNLNIFEMEFATGIFLQNVSL